MSMQLCELTGKRVNNSHALHWNNNSITIPMCDMLLCHLRKMSFYEHRYVVAYSYLLCTFSAINAHLLPSIYTYILIYLLYSVYIAFTIIIYILH